MGSLWFVSGGSCLFVLFSLRRHLRSRRDGSVGEDTCSLSWDPHGVRREQGLISPSGLWPTRMPWCMPEHTHKLLLKKVIWVIPVLFKILRPFHTCAWFPFFRTRLPAPLLYLCVCDPQFIRVASSVGDNLLEQEQLSSSYSLRQRTPPLSLTDPRKGGASRVSAHQDEALAGLACAGLVQTTLLQRSWMKWLHHI